MQKKKDNEKMIEDSKKAIAKMDEFAAEFVIKFNEFLSKCDSIQDTYALYVSTLLLQKYSEEFLLSYLRMGGVDECEISNILALLKGKADSIYTNLADKDKAEDMFVDLKKDDKDKKLN